MASVIDICNLALSHIGQKANVSAISPPEGSAEAQHCARFYPMARDALLEMHVWGFATRRVTLAPLTSPLANWLYCYAWPADCLRPVSLLPPLNPTPAASGYVAPSMDGLGLAANDFLVEASATGERVIYANLPQAALFYIALVTDTTKFTPLFTLALSFMLSSFLAGPITKDVKLADAKLKEAMGLLAQAMKSDASARKLNVEHVPPAMAARQ